MSVLLSRLVMLFGLRILSRRVVGLRRRLSMARVVRMLLFIERLGVFVIIGLRMRLLLRGGWPCV